MQQRCVLKHTTHTHTHTPARCDTHAPQHTHPLQVNLLKQPSSEDSGGSELEEQLSTLGEVFESDLDSAEEPMCEWQMGVGQEAVKWAGTMWSFMTTAQVLGGMFLWYVSSQTKRHICSCVGLCGRYVS